MKYVSTRGGGGSLGFSGTVHAGLASDGGLYVPESLPRITNIGLQMFSEYTYQQLAFEILHLLAPDIPKYDLSGMVDRAYTEEAFSNAAQGDAAGEIVPVRKVGINLFLAHLSNGPTLSFKDVALRMLGELFEYVLGGAEMNIIGATSGDTGSAAISAMLGRKGIRVFMLAPLGGTSPFQAAQMWSVNDPMIHNLAIRASFDPCQDIVKAINNDADFKKEYHLGAVNSINWARIAAQVVYYFWAYRCVNRGSGLPIDLAVPTGNFGNIYAAWTAKKMGLPIRRLILATNANDVLHEFFTTGTYKPRAEVAATMSPSMDITKASNFERWVYDLLDGDTETVAALWEVLAETGSIDLSDKMDRIKSAGIISHCTSEDSCRKMIKRFYSQHELFLDPHTAVAMNSALCHRDRDVPMVVMETAQPCKFDKDITAILGKPAPRPEAFVGIEDRRQYKTEMDPNPEKVKTYIRGVV